MTKIITISGKGGAGKTTTAALLTDEIARSGYSGRLLAVDGDPAMTLYLALGQKPPEKTIADIRDNTRLDAETIRNLPAGTTPAAYVAGRLKQAQILKRCNLREMNFDMLTMGWGETEPGCYCSINNLLSSLLDQIISNYDLVIIDNEAGLEHLSRCRVKKVDTFITVTDSSRASRVVARRIAEAAVAAGMEIGQEITVACRAGYPTNGNDDALLVPYDPEIHSLASFGSVVEARSNSPARNALKQIVQRILGVSIQQPAPQQFGRNW